MTRRELVVKAAAVLSAQMSDHPDPHVRRAAAEAILCHIKSLELLEEEPVKPPNPDRAPMPMASGTVPAKHSGFSIG